MKNTIKQLLKMLHPYKKYIIVIVFCLILSSVLSLLLPLFSRAMMDDGFIAGNQSLLIKLVLAMLFLTLITIILDVIREKIRIYMQVQLNITLSKKAIEHLYRVKMDYFNHKNHSQIFSIVHTDIDSICQIADHSLFFAFTQIFTILGGTIGLFILNYKLAVLVMTIVPIKYIITTCFAKTTQSIMNEFIKTNELYAKWFGDTFMGIRDVKLFDLMRDKTKEFDIKKNDEMKQRKSLSYINVYSNAIDKGLVQIMVSSIYIIGAIQVFDFETTLGSILAFITYSVYVTSPVTAIVNIKQHLYKIIPSINRFNVFMNLEEDKQGYISSVSNIEVIFNQVTLNYGADHSALNNISFKIPKDSRVAILGCNGSGKTSIINVLLRLYEAQEGSITLGGINIADIDLTVYRSLFSVVSQDVYLFNDTIKNNICLYKEHPPEQIDKVIKVCGLSELINEKSLDFVIGDHGSLLSGGQKQKISFARAMLHDAPIIILDEATSNTDSYSEKFINTTYLSNLNNKTIITISHNYNYLEQDDIIIFLDKGTLMGYGTYCELLQVNEHFKEFIESKKI